MIWTVLTKILTAHNLITVLSVVTSEPAALIAEEFHLVLLGLGQRCKSVKCSVQPEIRHDIASSRCKPLKSVSTFVVEDTRYNDG